MARGLDHVVHVVRDLDAAGVFYGRLGFTVGARNRHPWGTHNRIVQFPNCFLEILTVAETEKIRPHTDMAFSFGGFNRDFLAKRGEGLSMLAAESDDPAADKAVFDGAGFGGSELFEFSRKGQRPDGSETEVGFRIAFARDPASPNAGFFTMTQTRPENFWTPELQRHANGVRGLTGCVLVAENPTDHHIFLQTFVGVRDVQATSRGITIPTERGTILVLDPRAFEDTFGRAPPKDEGLRLAALSFAVAGLGEAALMLERNEIRHRDHRGKLFVDPVDAFGALLAFE